MERYGFNIKKIKETEYQKSSYTSGNKNPEKIYFIFSKESFSYISGNRNSNNHPIFQEVTFRARKMKQGPL